MEDTLLPRQFVIDRLPIEPSLKEEFLDLVRAIEFAIKRQEKRLQGGKLYLADCANELFTPPKRYQPGKPSLLTRLHALDHRP